MMEIAIILFTILAVICGLGFVYSMVKLSQLNRFDDVMRKAIDEAGKEAVANRTFDANWPDIDESFKNFNRAWPWDNDFEAMIKYER